MRREFYQGRLGGTSGVASLISGMSRAERRALHEAVKRRILKEQSTNSDPDFAASPIGSTISDKSGQELYKVKREGWQSVAPMTMAQVLAYVKPEHRASMEQQLTRLDVDGSLLLPLVVLGSPNIASAAEGNGLVVRKTGPDTFVERATHKSETIKVIYEKYKANLVYTAGAGGARTDPADGTYQIGDATVTISGETYTISVPSGNLNGFDSLFGQRSGVADIVTGEMQKTLDPAKTGGDIEIKIPRRFALEDSFMKKLVGAGLFGFGKIKFTKGQRKGDPFIHTSTLDEKEIASLSRILLNLGKISSRSSSQ